MVLRCARTNERTNERTRRMESMKTKDIARRVAVCLKTHCNTGSKRAFPIGILDRWHNCYLLTRNLFSSCNQRYLVWRAYDWVMTALCAVLLIFSFQFCLLFFHISLARPYQHCTVLLVLIRNIGHQRLPKFG